MGRSALCRTSEDVLNGLGLAADGRAPLQGGRGQARGWHQAVGVDLCLEGQQAAQELFLENKMLKIFNKFGFLIMDTKNIKKIPKLRFAVKYGSACLENVL